MKLSPQSEGRETSPPTVTSQSCDAAGAPPPRDLRRESGQAAPWRHRSGQAGFPSAQWERRAGLPFKECCDLTSPRRVTSRSRHRQAQREPCSP